MSSYRYDYLEFPRLTSLELAHLAAVDVPAPIAEYIGLNGCLTGDYRGSHQGFAYMMSVAPFVTNLVLLALIVHRSWSISKELGGVRIAILRRFVRDGVMYFAIISAFNIMNVAFWTREARSSSTLPLTLSTCLTRDLFGHRIEPCTQNVRRPGSRRHQFDPVVSPRSVVAHEQADGDEL